MPVSHSRNDEITYHRLKWVYHEGDQLECALPDIETEFANADRQVATKGKHNGKPFISPKLVAEKLGVDISLIPKYRKNGISWVPRVEVGRNTGKKRKPITEKFKYGYYGRDEYFWLEAEVEEFAHARNNMPEEPPAGWATLNGANASGDISHGYLREKIDAGEIGSKQIPLKKCEVVKGKHFFFTSFQKIVPQGQLDDFRTARIENPVSPDKLTVQETALIFGVPETTVYGWIYKGTKHLDGAKPKYDKGKALWTGRRDGKLSSRLRNDCYLLHVKDLIEIWNNKYPGKPWPRRAKMSQGQSANDTPKTAGNTCDFPALGISVDYENKSVSGLGKKLDFGRCEVQWHIFKVVLSAYPHQASMESIWTAYPGEKDNVSRNVNTNKLNKKLIRLGIRIVSRQLVHAR
jgi:hypothetical protein